MTLQQQLQFCLRICPRAPTRHRVLSAEGQEQQVDVRQHHLLRRTNAGRSGERAGERQVDHSIAGDENESEAQNRQEVRGAIGGH